MSEFEKPKQTTTQILGTPQQGFHHIDQLNSESSREQAVQESEPKITKKKFIAQVIDTSDQIENMARDAADRNMTASREELKGFRGFLKKIWKHNIAEEFFRQKEIAIARAKIVSEKNAFANEAGLDALANTQAKSAVLDRFLEMYRNESVKDDFLHAGESMQTIKSDSEDVDIKVEIKDLIMSYAQGSINDDLFLSRKEQVLAQVSESSDESPKNRLYADNLLEVAKNIRHAYAHQAGLRHLDIDLDIVLGKARTGVRTEANFSRVDRVTEKIQNSFAGRFANETTIAAAVATAYSAGAYLSQRVASSKLAAWGTFGASSVLAGGIAGARESRRLEMERSQHAREMAQGKTFESSDTRRKEMERFRHESRGAQELTESIDNAVFARDERGNISPKDLDKGSILEAIEKIAQAEARIKLSDTQNIDLIDYSHIGTVERERFNLDFARARAKVELRKIIERKGIAFDGETLESLLEGAQKTHIEAITNADEGIVKKDELFRKFKRNRAWKRAALTAAVAASIGASLSEAHAFISNDRQGFVEKIYDATRPPGDNPQSLVQQVPSPQPATASQGASVETRTKALAPTLSVESQTPSTHDRVRTVTAKDFMQANQHAKTIHRDSWFDNNTRRADLNELALRPGGVHGTGVDKNGNFVYSVKEMARGISRRGNITQHMHTLIEGGKLKMLFSLSGDSSSRVFEVPIDKNGNAVINPDSEMGKLLFRRGANGSMEFLGRYAEVAQSLGSRGGVDNVRVFATAEGKGIGGVDVHEKIQVTPTPEASPAQTEAPQVPDTTPLMPKAAPPIIPKDPPISPQPLVSVDGKPVGESVPAVAVPFLTRRPMEPAQMKKIAEITRMEYGYGGSSGDYGLLKQEEYARRFSENIKKDKDYDIVNNDSDVVNEYLGKQDEKYKQELEAIIATAPPMGQNVEMVITIPAFQEGKNLEKTLRNYARLRGKDKFEIVILENHARSVPRDNTESVVRSMQKEFPDMRVVLLHKVFDEKPTIGSVRKYLVDSVLARKQKSGIKKSTVIVSNDADLEYVREDYAEYLLETFKNEKVDAAGAKWDYPKNAYEKMPLFHASQRLWHYMDIALRNYYLKSPELIGRNSAFRSGAYAAVGGYNQHAKLAEDLEIGWMIKNARGYNGDRIVYDNRAFLVSNPRRAVGKMLSGNRLVQQYGDFHENDDIRNAPLDDLLSEKRDLKSEDFILEIQAIYQYYAKMSESKGGWVPDNVVKKVFDRAMKFLGLQYEIDEKENITVQNIDNLRRSLESEKI